MTPDRRLDQLEPLVADVLQKVDRLIEGQGQLFDMIVRVDQKADLAINKADLAAKGVAELTIITQRQYATLKGQLVDLKAGQQALETGVEELKTGQQKLETGFEALKTGQQTLENGFEVLKAGQDAILQYLQKRLP